MKNSWIHAVAMASALGFSSVALAKTTATPGRAGKETEMAATSKQAAAETGSREAPKHVNAAHKHAKHTKRTPTESAAATSKPTRSAIKGEQGGNRPGR